MIKKIYSVSFSIVCAGFLWSAPTAHADPSCETFCQPNICSASPDLASVCFTTCPQAQACHMAAFDEFRRLHEIHNKPNRWSNARKDRHETKQERERKSRNLQSDISILTSELPAVKSPSASITDEPSVSTETSTLDNPIKSEDTSLIPLPSNVPVIGNPSVGEEGTGDLLTQPKPTIQPTEDMPTDTSLNIEPELTGIPMPTDTSLNNEPVLTEIPEPTISSEEPPLIPPPPPPPSDLPVVKNPSVKTGEEVKDFLTQLNNQKGQLKKPAEITDSPSVKQNETMQLLRKAMEARRGYIAPDESTSSKDNAPPDDWDE